MTNRRVARESALQMLYQLEITGDDLENVAAKYWSVRFPAAEARSYADRLVGTVQRRREEIDELLTRHLTNYRLSRLGVVERSLLRSACAELLLEVTPARVVIDESVEIARDYAGDDAAGLVNAVLDRLARAQGLL
jgi:transcription antitermination protein NusB